MLTHYIILVVHALDMGTLAHSSCCILVYVHIPGQSQEQINVWEIKNFTGFVHIHFNIKGDKHIYGQR